MFSLVATHRVRVPLNFVLNFIQRPISLGHCLTLSSFEQRKKYVLSSLCPDIKKNYGKKGKHPQILQKQQKLWRIARERKRRMQDTFFLRTAPRVPPALYDTVVPIIRVGEGSPWEFPLKPP